MTQERCGVFMSDGLEGSGTGWVCGRPKGHPHDGTITAGNHQRYPLPQDSTAEVEMYEDAPEGVFGPTVEGRY